MLFAARTKQPGMVSVGRLCRSNGGNETEEHQIKVIKQRKKDQEGKIEKRKGEFDFKEKSRQSKH